MLMTTNENPPSARPVFLNPWLLASGLLLLLVVMVLIAIPYAISYGAKQWILENGGHRVQVEDVDFNPFTATLALKGVQVQVDEETTLDIGNAGVGLAWTPLFQHRAHVRAINLEDFSINIERDESGAIRIGGVIPPESEEEVGEIKSEVPWEIGIDQVTLANCEIEYRDPQFQTAATINKLTLGELAHWTPEKTATLHLDGLIDDSAVKFEGQISPFAAQPGGSGRLQLSDLQLEKFVSFAKPALTTLAGTLSIDSKIGGQQDQNNILNVTQEGTISAGSLSIVTGTESITNENIDWDGSVTAAVATESGTVQLQTDGTLRLDKIVLALPQRNDLLIRNDATAWKGTVKFDNSYQAVVAVSGDLELHEIHATAEKRNINLIDLQTLTANTIVMDALDQITIAEIDIKALTLAGESTPDGATGDGDSLNHIPDLSIAGLRYNGDAGLSIDAITETDVSAIISRDSDGQWNAARLVDVLAKLGGTDAESGENADTTPKAAESDQAQAGAAGEKAGVRIGHWLATGNNTLTFRDSSAVPPFETTLNISKLEATEIDSHKPDNPSPITIEGSIGKHTAVNMSGTLSPFAEPVGYNLKGKIDALELPPLSSYTASQMGFELDSGQLDAEFGIKAEQGKLEGNTDLTIRQLDIGSVDDKRMAEMESSLSVPLDVALSMLRDDNNVIHLEVPFSGTPDSPDFDASDAINQALASALKQGSMTYLTMALQPYGTLITVAKYAGEQATKVRLNPIEFEPGLSALDSSDFDYLAKVAGILKERPKIDIKICGAAVQADRTALIRQTAASSSSKKDAKSAPDPAQIPDAQLVKLAEQRDDVVKDHLIEKQGVSAKRLVACEANLDLKEADAKPRADLLI